MRRSIDYLQGLDQTCSSPKTKQQINVILKKLYNSQNAWEFYFGLTIHEAGTSINDTIRIGLFTQIASIVDRIYNWSSKKISCKKGGRLDLIMKIRNLMIHGDFDIYPVWIQEEGGLLEFTIILHNEIDLVKSLTDWKNNFSTSHPDYQKNSWNDEYCEEIIKKELIFGTNNLYILDNEIQEMLEKYFS